jgi:hypothetical protein
MDQRMHVVVAVRSSPGPKTAILWWDCYPWRQPVASQNLMLQIIVSMDACRFRIVKRLAVVENGLGRDTQLVAAAQWESEGWYRKGQTVRDGQRRNRSSWRRQYV